MGEQKKLARLGLGVPMECFLGTFEEIDQEVKELALEKIEKRHPRPRKHCTFEIVHWMLYHHPPLKADIEVGEMWAVVKYRRIYQTESV